MTTITGTCENTLGQSSHVVIEFKSKSTPIVVGGVVTLNTTKRIRSNPTTGAFSIELVAGKYDVTYYSRPTITKFEITVPEGNDTISIEEVTSSELTFVFVAPNTVWNGQRAGHITFLPIENPGVPTLSEVVHGAGNQGPSDSFKYVIAWMNASGDVTAASDDVLSSAPSAPENATRVTFPSRPSGVANVLIYRSNDGSLNRYLLATVPATSNFYDDFESADDFNNRLDPDELAPTFNLTAGIIYADIDEEILYFSTSGLRCLASAQFDFGIKIMTTGIEWAAGSGSPEGVRTAPIGSLWSRTDVGELYWKQSGAGNSGWKLMSSTETSSVFTGSASPEGSVTAPVGSIYNEISAGVFIKQWIKVSGTGNTGWD